MSDQDLYSITNEEIALLPKLAFNGTIKVIKTSDELDNELMALRKERVVGFDTETKPSFRKGENNLISIMQLATDSVALIVKLKETKVTNGLKQFLENPEIFKVGAAVRDDIKAIQKLRKINPEGFIDLQSLVPRYGIDSLSVRKMAAIVLGYKVSKSQQLSNWDADSLTEAQQQYAAVDAWACRLIYLKLLTFRPLNDVPKSNS